MFEAHASIHTSSFIIGQTYTCKGSLVENILIKNCCDESLYSNTTGYSNTASGQDSLYQNTTGYNNTASGNESLYSNTTGYGNTAIGFQAGDAITTGSKNIMIGYDVNAVSNTASNQLNIGNTIYANGMTAATKKIGIAKANPANTLHVNGQIMMANGTTACSAAIEGSQRYNNVSKRMEFCNGTVWASIAGGTGSNKVLLSTQTASNSTQIVFAGIDGTYDKYVVEMYNVRPATNQVGLYLSVSADGGSTYLSGASDYSWAFSFIDIGASPTLVSDDLDTRIELVYDTDSLRSMSNLAISSLEGEVYLITPANTNTHHRLRWNIGYGIVAFAPDSRSALVTGSGTYRANTAYNAIKLHLSSGNISTGTFKLYGLQ